jgi:hypothetical protein
VTGARRALGPSSVTPADDLAHPREVEHLFDLCQTSPMAGGMNKRGSFGLSMTERVQVQSKVEECPLRHCWVQAAVPGAGQPVPGLLAEWRHTDEDEWWARVVYPSRPDPGRWSLVEEWVPARRVRPAVLRAT